MCQQIIIDWISLVFALLYSGSSNVYQRHNFRSEIDFSSLDNTQLRLVHDVIRYFLMDDVVADQVDIVNHFKWLFRLDYTFPWWQGERGRATKRISKMYIMHKCRANMDGNQVPFVSLSTHKKSTVCGLCNLISSFSAQLFHDWYFLSLHILSHTMTKKKIICIFALNIGASVEVRSFPCQQRKVHTQECGGLCSFTIDK